MIEWAWLGFAGPTSGWVQDVLFDFIPEPKPKVNNYLGQALVWKITGMQIMQTA